MNELEEIQCIRLQDVFALDKVIKDLTVHSVISSRKVNKGDYGVAVENFSALKEIEQLLLSNIDAATRYKSDLILVEVISLILS